MAGDIIEVTDNNFAAEVLESPEPVSSTSGRRGAGRAGSSRRTSRSSTTSVATCVS